MISLQPTLENNLVIVRPLKANDFESLYQAANDPKIWELHQNPDRYQLSVFKKFFKDAIAFKTAFVVIDKSTNTIIGSSRYRVSQNSEDAIEIGWTFLSREYWGGIYNASFKNLMINYAFQYFDYILWLSSKINMNYIFYLVIYIQYL